MTKNEWEELAGFIFRTPVRAKRPPRVPSSDHGHSAILARLARVARRAPEVMVKITGSARGFERLKAHLAYITRNGKLLAETGDGGLIEGSRNVKNLAYDWWCNGGTRRRKDTRDTINLVLSMPPGTDRAAVAAAAAAFANIEFGGQFDYVMAVHEDTDHPHAHLTVKALGLQGQRLKPDRADLQAWREAFAEALRARGVDAEATPRRSRGALRKGKSQAMKHLEARRGWRWKLEQAVKKAEAGKSTTEQQWEAATREEQRKVRYAWATIGRCYEAAGYVAHAIEVKQFLATMPAAVTEREREEMLTKARALLLQQQNSQARDNGIDR